VTLFVDASHQDAALRDVLDLCGGPSNDASVSILQIDAESDVAKARAEARRVCDALGASPFVMQKVATIVSELARNMVLYANGGLIEIGPAGDRRKRLVVRASDHGPGIPNLQEIMSGKYKSKTGLGRGILGTKRLADQFEISTGATGTRIVAEVAL
jgi:serine/threonine-protein kinase RsbT